MAKSTVLKNIVSKETEKEKPILEKAPKVDSSLLKEMGPSQSILLLFLKIFFIILFISSIFSIFFFTSQLTDKFDFITPRLNLPNASHKVSASNAEIINLQTEINTAKYLQLKGYFDRFSFYGDQFLQTYQISISQTASSVEKTRANNRLNELKQILKPNILAIAQLYSKNFTVSLVSIDGEKNSTETFFKEELIKSLKEKAANLKDEQPARFYSQTVNLVGNNDLKNKFLDVDFDKFSNEEIYFFIKEVNSILVNDLSIIHQIKDERIAWSDIINEIERRTITIDAYYDQDFYNELGGIRYNSYDFDRNNRRISISGQTKRFDTTNFTLIANLIDEFNRSYFFENAEMRSFSKSGSLEQGYTASLQIAFNLIKRN